jgi:FMN phosphatase YigB (HAD superfamily)
VEGVSLSGLSDVRALTFDVFGTTVDWRSGVAAEARRLGSLTGVKGDWEQLADAWRALYMPSMAAHKGDLRAAQAAGMLTAFVERPLEKGHGGGADLLPDEQSDIQATDFLDLADKLGC